MDWLNYHSLLEPDKSGIYELMELININIGHLIKCGIILVTGCQETQSLAKIMQNFIPKIPLNILWNLFILPTEELESN